MKNISLYPLLIIALFFYNQCFGQSQNGKKIYNEEFKWTIFIPEGYDEISAEDWQAHQQTGIEMLEEEYEEEIVNETTIIFVFSNGELNYFESIYQPFDEEIDGDFIRTFDDVNKMLIQAMESQIPDTKVESRRSTQMVDGLLFQTSKMKVIYPNNFVLYSEMYSRIFGKKEFSVNIIFLEEEKGNQMRAAFLNSKFEK